MAESADYDPGPWAGYDFKSARSSYDRHVRTSFDDALKANVVPENLVPDEVVTDAESSLIVFADVTGSMGSWPATIFSKLPYLDIEGRQYLGETMEICFGAVGDANGDKYPLQVRPFSKGLDLKTQLEKLVIEGGGGGQTMETYELAALYMARNFKYPKATRRPIIIFIGDEQPYKSIDRVQAKQHAKVALGQNVLTADVYAELQENCSVYLVRKAYDQSSEEPAIKKHWVDLLGADHIAELPDAARVVDVIFGILAQEAGKVEYFRNEIEDRQKPDQVKTVYKSLATIYAKTPKKLKDGKSTMFKDGTGGLKSKSLLGD